ncbi:hypothetical protein Scani_38830 [Streptomyces caniferus]|uniref:Uncharacterized protein n=1 Tax=Streptomyces caniferus TaxID=285557 RepID=A0A640SDG1_9ACTN|nr:hypothetical protein Scani_38830 [Streptomyces caniferus]
MEGFPRDVLITAKAAINAISLPDLAAVRADAALFQRLFRGVQAQRRMAGLFERGLRTRGRTELDLGDVLGAVARRADRERDSAKSRAWSTS